MQAILQTMATRPRQLLLGLIGGLTLSLLPGLAAAQQDADNNWYQVEVYIFADDQPNTSLDERWPIIQDLSYPNNITALRRRSTSAPGEASAEQLAEDEDLTLSQLPEDVISQSQREPAFVKLPRDTRELTNAAAQLRPKSRYRKLYHEVWRQPLLNRKQSSHILIRGGKKFVDQYELEGYINISVERYLHISTDLWLSNFQLNRSETDFGQQALPALPLHLLPEEQQQQLLSLVDSEELDNEAAVALLQQSRQRDYQVTRTVVLREQRRMRSGELHYLDHPLMGVLVKVTPYSPEKEPEKSPEKDLENTVTTEE